MAGVRNYILFPNVTAGLQLEALLKREGIKYTITPAPREFTACCGISIMYDTEDESRIKRLVDENSIDINGYHSISKEYKSFYV